MVEQDRVTVTEVLNMYRTMEAGERYLSSPSTSTNGTGRTEVTSPTPPTSYEWGMGASYLQVLTVL